MAFITFFHATSADAFQGVIAGVAVGAFAHHLTRMAMLNVSAGEAFIRSIVEEIPVGAVVAGSGVVAAQAVRSAMIAVLIRELAVGVIVVKRASEVTFVALEASGVITAQTAVNRAAIDANSRIIVVKANVIRGVANSACLGAWAFQTVRRTVAARMIRIIRFVVCMCAIKAGLADPRAFNVACGVEGNGPGAGDALYGVPFEEISLFAGFTCRCIVAFDAIWRAFVTNM